MIHIIDKVSLTSNGLVATGTKDLIHLHQGDMDGACAVYSLMMCLIINRSIKRLDVTDLDKKHDGRSSKGRLVDAFLNNAKGLVREGYELEVLNTELLHAFKKCVSTAWYSTENAKKQELYAIIKSSLDEHSPIELGFSWKRKGGHAITVIGYEEQRHICVSSALIQGILFKKVNTGIMYWILILTMAQNSTLTTTRKAVMAERSLYRLKMFW